VVGVGMYFWDPRKMELLTQTTEGQVLLGLAIVLELVGIFVTRRILDLDI
jgi:Flp pilus assembly protein TadB